MPVFEGLIIFGETLWFYDGKRETSQGNCDGLGTVKLVDTSKMRGRTMWSCKRSMPQCRQHMGYRCT